MRLARETHEQLEKFFREYFEDEHLRLPKMRFYGNRIAEFLNRKLDIWGITIGRFIFIRPDLFVRGAEGRLFISKELLAHEVAHALQYQRLGWLRFFYNYLKGYWKALKTKKKWDAQARMEAYLEIPLEAEARNSASAFLQWLEKARAQNTKRE
jgi:hypothetical protein